MNLEAKLRAIRDVVQEDIGNRGLARDPQRNLINACPEDFAQACHSIASCPAPRLGILTGFLIPSVTPALPETDGPLGTIFLARVFQRLDWSVVLACNDRCLTALIAGMEYHNLTRTVAFTDEMLSPGQPLSGLVQTLTHWIAIERVGPSHTPRSIRQQPGGWANDQSLFFRECPPSHFDRCHTMRGRDITDLMTPVHTLFEAPAGSSSLPVTIGIGDGGNEIGMGKIPWETIQRNIPNGGMVACRIPTDHLIVAGVSNWGAYALGAGVALCRGERLDPQLFDPEIERATLRTMVEAGDLVDGVTGESTVSVDGLDFDVYIRQLVRIREIMEA